MLAPRSVAVLGASDREGNLGGVAVGFLKKFGFAGPIWPVNSGRATVGDLPCFPSLRALPSVPELAILAIPAESVAGALEDCIAAGVPAALAWAGGFAEAGEQGAIRQRQLEALCRASSIKFCGPNCIGVINTSIGLTASFSSMMFDLERFVPGVVSMVSQSGGISVMAHARAEDLGLGFRVTISCGNEASLGIADFIRALALDEGTRVIAVYAEALSNPAEFVEALAEAKRRSKPVVMLKGGASAASGRAALAHTGRLAGVDRTYDAIFREFAVIRVHSTEELLDVCLQLASFRPGQLPAGDRALVTTFGGGSGVICTDQCVREGLQVRALEAATRQRIASLLTPLSSTLNPIDLTPGMMTNPKHRANLPAVLQALADAPEFDVWLFLAAGMGALAPELVAMLEHLRSHCAKPICVTWQAPPEGIVEDLAARGVYVFGEHARAARAVGHLVRHASSLRNEIRQVPQALQAFAWSEFAGPGSHVFSEPVAMRILEAAGLPVARGRLATTSEEAVAAAKEIGFPVALKGISAAITHRAAAGLVALNVTSADAVVRTDQMFRARAAERGVTLEGTWVQHMSGGDRELLVTAFRDAEFGVIVGCGVGGGMTEIVDDVVFARAPVDEQGALNLVASLRTLRRISELLSERERQRAAAFIARFSALAAGAPWQRFTFEVNPVKLGDDKIAAVDGLLVIG